MRKTERGVTASVLAEHLGVSGRSITDLAKRGIAVRLGGGFDLKGSTKNYCDHLRRLATGRGEASVANTAAAERTRLARAQADKVELANAHARGGLLDAAAVQSEWSDILRGVRAGMLAVPSRAAQRLPHLTPFDVAEIDAAVRQVLTEIGGS